MAGGLTQSIEKIAKQHAALKMGNLSKSASEATARPGKAAKSEPGTSGRRSLLLGGSVDIYDTDCKIERWIREFDQLETIYGWYGTNGPL